MTVVEIIANLNSGKGNGKKCVDAITAYLDERSIPYNIHETAAKGHAEQLAKRLCSDGAETIVALGGDGTFHEVLNGIDFTRSRLGLVPAGRGNDFAKGTGAAALDPIEAIADVIRGEPAELDYIDVSDRRCINVAGTGLDVEVLLKTARSGNKLSYVASLFRCLLSYKPYSVKATVNGDTLAYDCIMAGVCNGSQIGNGIRLSPISLADDGKLDLIIMEKPKHTPTVFVMPKFVKGKHMNKPYTHHVVCEQVYIETPAPLQLDGEIYYDLKFDAKIVKSGLKTFKRSD
jgi:YegS/Rv2252/BmrU family lipid kinase